MTQEEPELLWSPGPGDTRLSRFADWARDSRGVLLDDPRDYGALHRWSVSDLPGFWSALAEFSGVRFGTAASSVLEKAADGGVAGADWFPGATLNYAEHALRPAAGGADADVAVIAVEEGRDDRTVTYGELRDLVARVRAGLVRAGVGRGDRVAAMVPNTVETLAGLLATASLGAIWSSCSPDFGARAAGDRFAQIEPVVLLTVTGYRYGGRYFDTRAALEELRGRLPGVGAVVLLPSPGDAEGEVPAGAVPWAELTAEAAPLEFEQVPFGHPLWILYSSGTTGLPKGIMHGHGGILLEHLKSLGLQLDLGPGDRFFWFTTTGWMMWNFLVSGLLTGSTIVLFDGHPGHPDLSALWRLAERHGVQYFGTSAPFVQSCIKAGVRPSQVADLSALRALGSTGAPLDAAGFRWLAEELPGVQLCSVSGGTDVCTAFVGAAPTVEVRVGELSCAALGAAVTAFGDDGKEVIGEVGELVLTEPMPSMPVAFWADPDGSRLREAYFEHFPGVWRHGDWVVRTDRDSFVIHGRSDSTLNRGGIRMGTADFYAVVEEFGEVADSLVVDTTSLGDAGEGALLCFLVLAPGASLGELVPRLKTALRRELSPRHVPDAFHVVDEIPRTLNGKKCEVPVKRILAHVPVEKAVALSSLRNPSALDPFLQLARDDAS